MLAVLISLNAHNFPNFQPILMILVSKFMVYRALFDKTYLSLGLLSQLTTNDKFSIYLATELCLIFSELGRITVPQHVRISPFHAVDLTGSVRQPGICKKTRIVMRRMP